MSITVSKYHHIGNEKLVEILADGDDAEATAQLKERNLTDERIAEHVEAVRERRREV